MFRFLSCACTKWTVLLKASSFFLFIYLLINFPTGHFVASDRWDVVLIFNSISFLFVLLKGIFYLFANSFSTGHFVATDRNTVDEITAQKGYVLMQ